MSFLGFSLPRVSCVKVVEGREGKENEWRVYNNKI